MKLLLIEDRIALCESLSFLLKLKGFDIDICHDGSVGLERILKHDYHIIILEQYLPIVKGIDLLKKIRKMGISVPALMITENIESEIKKSDFYITKYIMKPFDTDRLYEYINQLLYPPAQPEDKILSEQNKKKLFFSDITFFPSKRLLIGKGNYCTTLSERESKIMGILLNSPSKTVNIHTLWENAWDKNGPVDIEGIGQYITFLKRRLKKVGSSLDLIKTDAIKYRLVKNSKQTQEGYLLSDRKIHSISEFTEYLENDYPRLNFYLLYSEQNIRKYERNLTNTYNIIEKIFNELCKYNNKADIYLRLHGYKGWIVVRIQGRFLFPEKNIGILKTLNTYNTSLSVSHEDNSVIIKMAIEKS